VARSKSTRSEIEKQVTRLRKRGLTKARAGRAKARPGGSAYALLRKFRSVLSGEAAVLKAPADVRKKYKGTFPEAYGKVVVPKKAGERPRISRKVGAITRKKYYLAGERPFTSIILPKITSLTQIPRGPGISYRIYVGKDSIFFIDYEAMREYLEAYSVSMDKSFQFKVGRIEVLMNRERKLPDLPEDEE